MFPSWTYFLCRQLQRGPGNSEVNPKSIKENLRRGLEALKAGLSILKVCSNGLIPFFLAFEKTMALREAIKSKSYLAVGGLSWSWLARLLYSTSIINFPGIYKLRFVMLNSNSMQYIIPYGEGNDVHTTKSRTRMIYSIKDLAYF